jgi:hypothetical protein
MNQLQKDINLFLDVHDSTATATVGSFEDENEANYKQVIRKLLSKLSDYLKMHWIIHAEQHQSQKLTLNVLLDWVNRKNYCVKD